MVADLREKAGKSSKISHSNFAFFSFLFNWIFFLFFGVQNSRVPAGFVRGTEPTKASVNFNLKRKLVSSLINRPRTCLLLPPRLNPLHQIAIFLHRALFHLHETQKAAKILKMESEKEKNCRREFQLGNEDTWSFNLVESLVKRPKR